LKDKEEATVRKNVENALNKATKSVEDLTETLEAKTSELEESAAANTEQESKIQELTTELEAAQEELKNKDEELASTVQTLEDMTKDRAAEDRMAELEDAGVVHSDTETQTAKVREMSDEDFASYKDELVSIRAAVVSELAKASETAEADAKAEEEAKKVAEEAKKAEDEKAAAEKADADAENADDETASEEEEDEESASEDDEESTVPANINPAQAAMASLNMEYIPSADVVKKYTDLGAAMAKRMQTKKEE